MGIVKFKTDGASDKYDRHISNLEERNATLVASISNLEARCRKLEQQKDEARLKALQGVSAFMSHMYASLGNIQGELLKHIAQVTKELNVEHSARAEELLNQVTQLLIPLKGTEDLED